MESLLWTALFLPLAGFIFQMTFSSVLSRRVASIIGPGTVLLSFLCFLNILYSGQSVSDTTLYTWIPLQGLHTGFTLHLDNLSLLMTLIITGVGFLIHAYSVGYMDHEKDFARYFAVMNFFIFSMLLLVLAANLVLLFAGWEGVGVASYLLIGFWYKRPTAQKAAKKAFVVNRIGDLGLLLGIFLTFSLFGTSDMQQVCERAPKEFAIGAPIITLLSLLYFWGACGKSAQMPLHTWLPDAMEGPTPVSALIHAATMVTAGVYLVVRMHPVFEVSPDALAVVAVVGAITSLFAALCATSQTDVKRVLAYSTLSQLGLMFLACGCKAYFAAMFHLTTHAFVKALLFLSAGNVIHMLHGTTEMAKMGGLARYLKQTNVLFLLGVLSMAGIPPLAIFFSKDLLLEDISGNTILYMMGLAVSLLTAFYLTRAYFLTFQGKSNVPAQDLSTLHDAPKIMTGPVAILGVLTVFGGLLGFAINKPPVLMEFLEKVNSGFSSESLVHGFHLSLSVWISIAIAVLGVAAGAIIYSKFTDRLGKTVQFFYQAFYINQLYAACIVWPMRAISKCIAQWIEPKVFDSSLEVTSDATYKAAGLLQQMQSGQIRSYISWIVAGSSLMLLYLIFEGF